MHLSPPNLVAIDPGGITGVAVLSLDPVKLITIEQFPEWYELERFISQATEVVYERFQHVGGHFDAAPVRTIGVIQYLCNKYGIKPAVQVPADRSFIDRRFPGLVVDLCRDARHAGDALRHGLVRLHRDNRWYGESLK